MPTLAPASVTELKLLGIAVLIGLLQLVWEALAAQSQRGFGWALGARDQKREVSGVPARLQRALHNYLETFPMFVAALLASILLGRTSPSTLIGAWLYVVGARGLCSALCRGGAYGAVPGLGPGHAGDSA